MIGSITMDKFVGKRLDGRYEIREIIGIGGMAVVYKAYDCIEDRIVAVKILKEEFIKNEEFITRFKNESKAIAVLNHPNIVKVYDVSFGDLIQYIVMEYVDGVTLKEYINKQGSLRWKDAVYLTIQVLRALQHAHDKGIVHRDVKPQNIMLLADGTIKVTDFGIARFARSEHKTMTDKAIGSVHYISPEQAKGEITDEKADIYSVGVMLYEMLTGKLPFEAESAVSVAIMQLQKDPVLPREINNTIPVGLEQITMHAMQKDVAKRYKSAAEMLRDLEEFRRSPDMVFDYTYFVDDEPTRFVDVVNTASTTGVAFSAVNDLPEDPIPVVVGSGNYIGEEFDDEDDDEEPREKSPVIPILAGVAIAFILVAAVVAFFLYKYLGTKTDGVVVPNFVGLVYDEMIEDSRYSDFNITVQYEFDDEIPAGEIISQSLKEGRTIKKTEEITIIVSKGPETVKIPKVDGLNIQDAKMQLTRAGLKYNEIPQPSESVTKDCVIMTNPAANLVVHQGETIDVYVSTGPDVVWSTVGEYTNLTEEVAKQLIEKDGFKVGEVIYKDSAADKGYVIDQSHPATTQLEKGTAIDIYVSTGVLSYDYKLVVKDEILGLTFKDEYKDMKLVLVIDGTIIESETTDTFDANVREGEFEFDINAKTKTVTAYINIKFDNGENLKPALTYTIDMVNGTVTEVVVNDELKADNAESKYLVIPETPDEGGEDVGGGEDNEGDGTGTGGDSGEVVPQ